MTPVRPLTGQPKGCAASLSTADAIGGFVDE